MRKATYVGLKHGVASSSILTANLWKVSRANEPALDHFSFNWKYIAEQFANATPMHLNLLQKGVIWTRVKLEFSTLLIATYVRTEMCTCFLTKAWRWV